MEDTEAITNMDMEDSDDSSNVLRHSASLECMADVAAIWNPTSVTDVEWEAAPLLRLRQQFYLPFEALLCVSDAIHQHHDKKLQQVKVIYLKSVIIVCEINKFIFCTLPSYRSSSYLLSVMKQLNHLHLIPLSTSWKVRKT